MSDKFLSTILELARLGAVGVGAIVLLLAFILMFRIKRIDPEKGKLINRYMTLGFVFALAAGVLGLVPLFVRQGGPIPVRLSFSPNFKTQGLSPPTIEAPDGSPVQPGQKFTLEPSLTPQVVMVGVDDALEDVRKLRLTSTALATSVDTLTTQRDALAAKATPDPAVASNLSAASAETGKLQDAITQSIRVGDYDRAHTLSTRLNNSVLKAQAPVRVIVTSNH